MFDTATANSDVVLIPEGTYSIERRIKAWDGKTVTGTMEVKNGKFIIKSGSVICPIEGKGLSDNIHKLRKKVVAENDRLKEDVQLSSPSAAGGLLIGASCNGWVTWKDANGKSLDHYRKAQK
jgi:hypothetical protein